MLDSRPRVRASPASPRLVERELSVFRDDHAFPDTSMRLSDYVLQTFLVNIFWLAIANFHFQDGQRKFQDDCRFQTLSRAESDKKKAHADISLKLGKNVHEHE